MRELTGLIMLKELEAKSDLSFHQLKKKYNSHIVIIKRISYIYLDAIEDEHKSATTPLDGYIQLTELARKLCIPKSTLLTRIKNMQILENNLYFDYMKVMDVYFIRLDKEIQKFFSMYQSYIVGKKDFKKVKFCRLLGDLTVGFY